MNKYHFKNLVVILCYMFCKKKTVYLRLVEQSKSIETWVGLIWRQFSLLATASWSHNNLVKWKDIKLLDLQSFKILFMASVTPWALKWMAWSSVEYTPLRDSYMCNISISLSPGQWCSARRRAAINGGRAAQIAGSVNRPQDLFA